MAEPNVVEDWKWNRAVFHIDAIVCGFSSFKNHVSFSFFNGALMSDKHNLFQTDSSAKHMRSIRITSPSEIEKSKFIDYLKEAFSLKDRGMNKAESKKEIEIPTMLLDALNNNSLAKHNFGKMAYTYRKEYALFIATAKRGETKLKRLEKTLENLEQNKKMNEQYKC